MKFNRMWKYGAGAALVLTIGLALAACGVSLADLLAGLVGLPLALGAVTETAVRRTPDCFVYDVTATADADTTSTEPHGMGVIPDVILTPILQAPAALSLWAATTIDITNVVLTKATTMGSGNASAQLRVYCYRPR